MKIIVADALPSEIFLFCEPQLHGRFVVAIELLAQIVVASPRSVSIVALSDTLGQPLRFVREVLTYLIRAGLVSHDANRSLESWKCDCDVSTITLADVFRSVSTPAVQDHPAGHKICAAKPDVSARTEARQSVDLLLMQASMEINQVVMQHLQRFDLGRLKAITTAKSFFPANAEFCSQRSEYR